MSARQTTRLIVRVAQLLTAGTLTFCVLSVLGQPAFVVGSDLNDTVTQQDSVVDLPRRSAAPLVVTPDMYEASDKLIREGRFGQTLLRELAVRKVRLSSDALSRDFSVKLSFEDAKRVFRLQDANEILTLVEQTGLGSDVLKSLCGDESSIHPVVTARVLFAISEKVVAGDVSIGDKLELFPGARPEVRRQTAEAAFRAIAFGCVAAFIADRDQTKPVIESAGQPATRRIQIASAH